MNATEIRCVNDLALYEKLQRHPDVKRIDLQIERHEAEGASGIRRKLLANSVRLTAGMAPEIARVASESIKQLGVALPLELYVYSSPQFNAVCFKPEDERLYVMLSSSLIEKFSLTELKFVLGHELGHHVYGHHAIPIGYLLNGQDRPDPQLALELFAWSRYAEISADRAGALCSQDMDAVARALFKLASGLTSRIVQFSLDDFIAQVDDMKNAESQPGQGSSRADWFSTHPFSPLRVKALKLFERSELFSKHKAATSKADLEVGVQALLSLMEPSYLEAKTDTAEAMRRLLFAGLIAVADATNGISKKELEVFKQFFGKYAFTDKLDIDKIKQTLEHRMAEIKPKTSEPQRMQVLHDLCTMAQASGKITPAERDQLHKLADGMEIPRSFICQSVDVRTELD